MTKKIIGMGNAVLDILTKVENNFIDENNLSKGTMAIVSKDESQEILEKIESTLRKEFISNLSSTNRTDAHETMASIFNNFDRQTEALFMGKLEDVDRDAAERIKNLMFTFDDLGNLDASSIQTIIREIDKDVLALAMKGTSEKIKKLRRLIAN